MLRIIFYLNAISTCTVGFIVGLFTAFTLGFHTHLHVFSFAMAFALIVGVGGIFAHHKLVEIYELKNKIHVGHVILSAFMAWITVWFLIEIIA